MVPELSAEILQLITPDQAWNFNIVPVFSNEKIIRFSVSDQENIGELIQILEMLFQKEVQLEPIPENELKAMLSRFYRINESSDKKIKVHSLSNQDDFLFNVVNQAHKTGSSDIHLEIFESKCRIRTRIDGKLTERYIINREDYPALMNRIKILANLDIAEKRLPQDGRIYFQGAETKFDIRVSVLPTLYGEKAVLRLLSKDTTNIELTSLGFLPDQLEYYQEAIKKPNGIILISGPTGSGKTTTLYATLKLLNKTTENILTIEDPIEYTLEGVNQVQLKENIGLSFASALRTFLRQDPDIIMLGEIRDGETAQMAIRASLTGHLVLSTIHTNSAWGTISRLVDMGLQPYLVANTLSISIAQRLVRRLCPSCKTSEPFHKDMLPRSFRPKNIPYEHFVAKSCELCYYTGYKGRKAIYEVIPISDTIADMIKDGQVNEHHILDQFHFMTLKEVAYDLFCKGETSLNEIYPYLL